MQSRLRHIAAMTLAVAATAPALATTTVYTDAVAFAAALQPLAHTVTETFSDPDVVETTNDSFSFGGSFLFQAPGGFRFPGTFITTLVSGDPLRVDFIGPTAVGGHFFMLTSSTSPPSPMIYTLSDGTTGSFSGTSETDSFLGFTSTEPIMWLSFAAPANGERNAIGDLTVSDAATAVAPIPEPSTWLLMGLGLAGLALTRRQRTR